jgi:CBS domain-containing membrane protein
VWTLLKNGLSAFAPAPVGASGRDKLYGALGALLGLLCTEWIGRHALGQANPWFIAPMGASAVLLFAAPASPLAQPWSLMAGNVSAALVGVFFAQSIADPGVAAACAAAAAIAVMFTLRCLHPPSGAVALTAVLGGPSIAKLGYAYALYPVALNSVVLLCIAVVFNGALKRNYPRRHIENAHAGHAGRGADSAAATRLGFTGTDLDEALRNHDQLLDISKEDLADIVLEAERRASVRRHGDVSCADIMALDIPVLGAEDSVEHAMTLFERHRTAALPVADAQGRLLGMLAQADAAGRLRRLEVAPVPGEAPRVLKVRDCMRSEVAFATPAMPAIELVRPMAHGVACVPVLDADRVIAGVVRQADLIDALYQMTLAAPDHVPARPLEAVA